MDMLCEHALRRIGSSGSTPGTSYTLLQLLDGHFWLLLSFAWWIWFTCPSPPCSWMVLLMLPCHWLVWLWLVWRNWMVSRVLLCSWARTAMNCYCSFFAACWWWFGRFGWHHQLSLPICSGLCYYPGLTHRHVHCWWLGQSAWLLSMQWTL